MPLSHSRKCREVVSANLSGKAAGAPGSGRVILKGLPVSFAQSAIIQPRVGPPQSSPIAAPTGQGVTYVGVSPAAIRLYAVAYYTPS